MIEFVFATGNEHKLQEAREILGAGVQLKSLQDLGFIGDIPEEQPTLEGNAIQKAQFIFDRYAEPCFADDTGLEIDALNGRPGVFSARYAGPACSFQDNVNKVLQEMKGETNRSARFRCVIACIVEGKVKTFDGVVEGQILTEPTGHGGFGYDPIFQPVESKASFAQMSADQKHAISHRGRALEKFRAFLQAR